MCFDCIKSSAATLGKEFNFFFSAGSSNFDSPSSIQVCVFCEHSFMLQRRATMGEEGDIGIPTFYAHIRTCKSNEVNKSKNLYSEV